MIAEPPPPDDVLFRRGLFLVGEHDLTGASSAAILSKSIQGNERLFAMLGVLGTLIGKDQESDAVTMGPILTSVENLP